MNNSMGIYVLRKEPVFETTQFPQQHDYIA